MSPAAASAGGLRVTGLHVAHGTTPVLHGVDLHVPEHALTCVVGPSGCGKTTLLRAIAGFHRPAAGRIELAGRVLDDPPGKHLPAERRRVGYIPQDIALFPHLSVAANIGFGLPRRRRAAKVRELLELVDLSDYAGRHPHQLSGGQQQRIALARALAPEPELLLLDEPFSALDAGLRARVRGDVTSLLRRTKTTAILVTHDAQEALAFADLISIVDSGHVRQTGSPEQLYEHPVDGHVARALGEANLVPATADGAFAMTPLGRLATETPSPAARTFWVLVRPRQLIVNTADSSKTPPPAGAVCGRVVRSEFRGDDHRLDIAVTGLDSALLAHSAGDTSPGTTVWLTVRGAVHRLSD